MPLIVQKIAGDFKEDTDTFTKMDPYLSVTVGNTTLKTSVQEGAGKKPRWPDLLTFNEKGNSLKVVAMDKDITSDDHLAMPTAIPISQQHVQTLRSLVDIDIMKKGKLNGKVNVTVTFRP